MPAPQTLVEPTQHDLMIWFKMARNGDQCHVVTESGEPYTHLTRLRPTMVRWKMSGFTHKDTELSIISEKSSLFVALCAASTYAQRPPTAPAR